MEHEEDMDGLDPAYVVDMPEPTGESLGSLGAFGGARDDESDINNGSTVNGKLPSQSTPSKRSKGLSLADELAMAMSPGQPRDEESEEEDDREHTGELPSQNEDHPHAESEASNGEGLDLQMEKLQNIMHSSLDSTSSARGDANGVHSSSDQTQPFLQQLRQFSKSDEFLVEKMTSQFIKQMYDIARDREAQIRELREMERIITRLPIGAHTSAPISFAPAKKAAAAPAPAPTSTGEDTPLSLGELPPPPFSPSEVTNTPADDLQDSLASLLALLPRSSLLTSAPILSPTLPEAPDESNPQEYPITPNTPSRTTTASSPLHSLRNLTDDLVSSLERINEQTQVSRALTSNASRRLKALRGAVIGWKADLHDAEQSQAWIEQHELPGDALSAQSRESVKKFVESQMAGFESDLGRANDEVGAILAKG